MLTGRVTEVVASPPGPVFALVSDVGRLPEWNEIIQAVVERPATMAQDAEWVVELRVLGYRCQSRSRLIERDQQARHFVYRSQTDDGNPSYAVWSWAVADDPAGSRVPLGAEPEDLLAACAAGTDSQSSAPHRGPRLDPCRRARRARDGMRCSG